MSLHPGQQDFWFLPLGGCGEIGMNLNLYGHAGQWLMVDCGVTFERHPDNPGLNRVEMPDPSFIANRQGALAGIVITHAHEDHLGAVAHLWEQFRCPIYTTAFTRNVLLTKLRQRRVDAPIITIMPRESLDIGPFRVDWVPITHSTPETNALLIKTAVATVLHTADWKIDSAPIAGEAFDSSAFQALGRQGLDAVICDSTNAPQAGRSVSESELFEGLLKQVKDCEGRVVLACFSSNIARMQTLGNVAHVAGRYLGLLGRSINRMVQCARQAGYLKENFSVIDNTDLGYLLPEETMVVATGSQGERGAALHRLAQDSHPDMNLAAGDRVIFSAKTIPGNENEVAALIRSFESRQIEVVHADTSNDLLHASGHPYADELRDMYAWLKPRLAIPVHGENYHMQCNARIAEQSGVASTLLGSNGCVFDIIAGKILSQRAPVGRLWLDEVQGRLRRV